MVNIKNAKNRRSDIEVEGTIEDLSEPRTVTTKYGQAEVCDAYLVDEEDRIKLSLWGDDIKKVKNGDRVSIKGAYTNTYKNEVQLSIPRKNGILEVISR